MKKFAIRFMAVAACAASCGLVAFSHAQGEESTGPMRKVGYPLLESPHSNPIAVNDGLVYVTNTPSGTVDVIDSATRTIVDRIHVGIDPVGIAVRPDGKEVWVSNHVSDSVSIIDADPASRTFHVVIDTIQEFKDSATQFDEPVGIAFADNKKAYVALSSTNQIAVIDVETRSIVSRLKISAQDPRALYVRNGKLFVVPFESGNQTQLSGSNGPVPSDTAFTFNAYKEFIDLRSVWDVIGSVLSTGFEEDIIKNSKMPDKDLFVFDTGTDRLVGTFNTLGTLLYGITVDADLNVYIAQTDARNDVNGKAGTEKHGLDELQNRPFLNQITGLRMDGKEGQSRYIDLEPLPPAQPAPGQSLATPYAIDTFDGGNRIVATAAGSDVLFVLDAESGAVLSRSLVGAGPVGLALGNASAEGQAVWTYNAYDNSVSKLSFNDADGLTLETTLALEDQTNAQVKLGRKYFNSAALSTTGTFSCASCHPNGHIDQLIWVLDTPRVSGGSQIQPRNTMDIRGLRDTEPFHWDGIPGDPYGGINSASTYAGVSPNCNADMPTSCIMNLINGNVRSTMHLKVDGEAPQSPLADAQLETLAIYNLSVPYPPAPERPYDDRLSDRARKGFELFFLEGDDDPTFTGGREVCGDCHRMPFWVSTNTAGTGMDAPSWRGAGDRHMILPQGRLNNAEFSWMNRVLDEGRDEFSIWAFSWSGKNGRRHAFSPVWNMVQEGSTGFSGSFARQVTVNRTFHQDEERLRLLAALEDSASMEKVVLEAEGVFFDADKANEVALQFRPNAEGGSYLSRDGSGEQWDRSELLNLAKRGQFIGTFTARHGINADLFASPQPAIWPEYTLRRSSQLSMHGNRHNFPKLGEDGVITISGRHFTDDANVFIDGRRVSAKLTVKKEENVRIEFEQSPGSGLHFLQVQVPGGRMSNEVLLYVEANELATK